MKADARKLSPASFARRTMLRQRRIIDRTRKAALVRVRPMHVHDIRVALRRFRAALRLLKPCRRTPEARALDRRLSALFDALGGGRDWHVWEALLARPEVRRRLAGSPALEHFTAAVRRDSFRHDTDLRRALADPAWERALRQADTFMGATLAGCLADVSHKKLRRIVRRQLRRCLRKLRRCEPLAVTSHSEVVHDVRKLVRRGRYWSEFAVPLFGAPSADLGRALKRIADALGDWHDLDVHIEEVVSGRRTAPPEVTAVLVRWRQRTVREYRKAWRPVNSGRLERLLERLT